MTHRSQRSLPIRRTRPASTDPNRLAKLRKAIQGGEYETPEKLDRALRNLVEDLRKLGTPLAVSREDESGGELP